MNASDNEDPDKGDLLTVPEDGATHECSKNCWCKPALYYRNERTGRAAYVHNQVH